MAIPTALYTPKEGLKSAGSFATIPDSEDAARKQIQDMFDQILAIVNSIIATLGSVEDGASGADNIAATPIAGVTGSTVQEQLESLKQNQVDLALGDVNFGDIAQAGDVTTNYIADLAVTNDKIADSTIMGAKIGSKQITADHIADGAIDTTQLAQLAVTETILAANAVKEAKIADNAVTAGKIFANAVTTAKIANANITGEKIKDGTIEGTNIKASTIKGGNIAGGTITGGNIAGSTISEAKLDAALVEKLRAERTRKITASTSNPSGGSNGDIWIKLI